ncbi:uncharacterized protein LOC133806740 [Humulus lupulus]|nr:uncharacterized protein LOC133806740 [Humulus lupulus]
MILPSSFIGGPRDMRKRCMEAMTLVQRYGKPDIFLTMTCNPNWPKISNELLQHEEPQNRPDLVTRVFHSKLEQLKDQLFKKKIFGQVSAYVYVIEHQKRGIPHAHFLIILQRDWKLYTPESFDEIVSAEIPDKNTNIHLHNAVVKHMMHGPCGVLNPSNVCMKRNGCCKSNYPKKYAPNTNIGSDCFRIYKCSDNGVNVKVRGKNLDNRWVVPYNPYLLATFNCHVNVEICSTIKAAKYLYKYIYKGHDRVAFNLISEENNHQDDEIQEFQFARWIAPPEAMWRIYGFVINEMYPAVYRLHLHLEDQQSNHFPDANARRLLYIEFQEHYVWNHQHKQWTPRKKKTVIGRVVTANPLEVPTFRDAATLHGLLQRDNNLEECLQEASLFQMPASLRRLFAAIWFIVIQPIQDTFGSVLKVEINDEMGVEVPEEDITASECLNSEQHVYDAVLEKVLENKSGSFVIDGPGRTGKTFLYTAILATLRSRNLVALATASSGVAASILPGGRTTHSRFKLPLGTSKMNTYYVSK